MAREVRLRRAAKREYDDAAEWYEQQQPGLGGDFVSAVQQVFADLAAQPLMYPIIHKDVRQAPVPGFKYYAVLYQVRRTHVHIISVFHQSRDPAVWQSHV